MKIYLANGSPNCRKVQATVSFLNLEPEYIWLDFFKGEHKDPNFWR